jgi:hypothetical protein
MFGSVILEVAISLVFIYFLLSLACTMFNEWVSMLLALRARTLQSGIRNLLANEELADKLYAHPLIKGLCKQGRLDRLLKREGRPSYISPQSFSLALFEIIAPTDPDAGPKPFQEVREAITQLPEPLTKTLLPLLDNAEGDLKAARENVERWFDTSMDRVTGWYTRNIAVITLCFAILVVGLSNADTIMMAQHFSRDNALRAAVIEAVDAQIKLGMEADMTYSDVVTEIERLELPLGWSLNSPDSLNEFDEIASKIIGLVISVLAVALGAPFWFDVLTKIASLRFAGKRPEGDGE